MAKGEFEVAVIGGGAAGIAAARRLKDAAIDCMIIEARPRLGGRAWTITEESGVLIDLGCGWLHSADRNPWRDIAEAQSCTIDKTPPPWARPSIPVGFPLSDQAAFLKALRDFRRRIGSHADKEPDLPAAAFLEQRDRWNNLLNAISTYASGAELERVSARDLAHYGDTGVNWRVVEGYGTVIAGYGADISAILDCPAQKIDLGGRRVRVETAKGAITADAVVITLPSALLAEEKLIFSPALPEKTEAAMGLPLGLADKVFLSLSGAEEFKKDSRLIGRTDRSRTGTYHLRPFGRPQIEAYFGGALAAELESHGKSAFIDFAIEELVGLLGSAFRRRVTALSCHLWGADPFSHGSYSYALPGKAGCRATLAAPVDQRLFFAGEACSQADYSTAHGAYLTGFAAAEQVIAARQRARAR